MNNEDISHNDLIGVCRELITPGRLQKQRVENSACLFKKWSKFNKLSPFIIIHFSGHCN